MGKPSRRPERDPEPPPAVRERLVAAAEQHAAAARASAEAPAPRPPWTLRSILPESLLLPWWVVLFLSGYALLKLGMGLEHPCGVLGISGSVSRGAISKSYRALSMCTHPDKLRARSEDDMKRGELLFKRASRAREELLASMRAPGPAAPAEAHPSEAGGAGGEGEASAEAAAQATCSTELDAALYRGVVAVVSYLRELGLRHIGLAVGEFLWGVVSFEHGPTYTCSLLLLLLTLLSFVWALVSYLVATGPDASSLLQLSWAWSAADVICVANIMLLGATLAATANAGNEPQLSGSFAAGLALRTLLYELAPSRAWLPLSQLLRSQQLEFVRMAEVAARAHGGVGSCSGGPVRSALGWLGAPVLPHRVAVAAKAFLLLLPSLSAAQRREGRPARLRSGELVWRVLRRRLAAAATLCVLTCALVAFYATFELNAVNGPLGNLLTVTLAGGLGESLLGVRGRLRQAVFFLFFMAM
ncbi:hypothetical protein EMIHUDRAFT_204624 [Emiliania huxleyi CCMP1516]|uniref:J domain-containing protein n=2 Tax=Emiliania huxleyi TaxID=2903 RepID=A0A0D3JW12_EMIH1|nr:hypothetical protein EMIHUDRAFT_204624 [Emiliania huxleyi CCMP1516]EOD27697.1 hypothetical protein EMIHUDRAFT_204624 [Emiliania huxleyi CCMP1516]|eukprot:XP_005780126.1 hypothetical protein EMIHUDRAFT_204624 [Emiliania huxleyi CCMP1516]